jgi:transketolase
VDGQVHGAPLGDKDVAASKKRLGFDPEAKFFVPDAVSTDGVCVLAPWRWH